MIDEQVTLSIEQGLQLEGAMPTEIRFRCGYEQDRAGLSCGYALQHAAVAAEALLWGGSWSEKGWNDPHQLVRVPGGADGTTRLRLHFPANYTGIDIGAGRTAIRWERLNGNKEAKASMGVLAVWGITSDEPEDNSCDTDPFSPDCLAETAAGILSPSTAATAGSGSDLAFNRAVMFATADTQGWRWQSTLAGAAYAAGCTAAAAGLTARYSSGKARAELHTQYETAGYRKEDAPEVFVLQPTLALTTGSMTGEVRLRVEGVDLAAKQWRFILAGRRDITVNQVNTVYTAYQVQTAKNAAWRVFLEVRNNPDQQSETCGSAECPWLWPDASISTWTLQLEGVLPTAAGRFGARLKVGESRNGRLNWWYTRPSGKRALSAQSHIGVVLEGMYYRQAGAWEYRCEFMFSEEIRFRFNSWETPDAHYLRIAPQVRYVADDYIISGGLNWAVGTEYDGTIYTDCVPVLELSVNL